MLNEFHNDYKRVVAVAGGGGGALAVAAEVYAQDYYRAMLGVSEFLYGDLGAALQSSLLRRVRAWLQRLFLPDGYPNSVSEDLLPVALWDLVQLLCSNVTSTLAMRALLLTAGVGESTASLTSSTLSWVLRDGVRMLASVLFASHVSVQLDYRCKTWRLLADVANDVANFMEVIAPWLPPLLQLRLATIVAASALRAVVGVAGGATRAAMTQHFAKLGNAADVTATTSNRDNAGSLVGLLLGSVVAYATPARSRRATLLAFLAFTLLHGFANYQAIRATVLRQLNAPRVEWCLRRYVALEASLSAMQQATTSTTTAATADKQGSSSTPAHAAAALVKVTMSAAQQRQLRESFALPPWRANREEALLLVSPLSPHALRLPPQPPLLLQQSQPSSAHAAEGQEEQQQRGTYVNMLTRNAALWWLRARATRVWAQCRLQLRRARTLLLPQLHVHIHYGVSLYELLADSPAHTTTTTSTAAEANSTPRSRHGLTAATRHALVARIDECLSVRGVALLYDAVECAYYVVFAERFTSDGHPQSWRIFHEQAEQLRSIVVAGAATAAAAAATNSAATRAAAAAAQAVNKATQEQHSAAASSRDDTEDGGGDEAKKQQSASVTGVVEADVSTTSEVQHVCDDMNATAAALGDTRIRSGNRTAQTAAATNAEAVATAAAAGTVGAWQRTHRMYGGGECAELAYSQLWAYFYAYSHQRACGLPAHTAARSAALHKQTTTNTTRTDAANKDDNTTATPGIIARHGATADEAAVTLHVIASLRADGVLDLNRQVCHEHHYDADDDDDGHTAASTHAFVDDELYPSFMRFTRALVRSGWVLDRLLVADKGWRVAVQHV